MNDHLINNNYYQNLNLYESVEHYNQHSARICYIRISVNNFIIVATASGSQYSRRVILIDCLLA